MMFGEFQSTTWNTNDTAILYDIAHKNNNKTALNLQNSMTVRRFNQHQQKWMRSMAIVKCIHSHSRIQCSLSSSVSVRFCIDNTNHIALFV